MFNHIKIFSFFFFLSVGTLSLNAQSTDFSAYLKPDTSLNNIIYYHNNKADYLINNVFKVNYDVFMTHYYANTTIPNNHHYLYLNNLGSAVKDMIFHTDNVSDYRRQENVFQPYAFNHQNIKYFQNKKAYTSVSYSNGTDGNQFFEVNFARNIYKGLNLQLDYFVNYADQTFVNSQIMNQFFNTTLNYISQNGRYRANASFIRNRAYIQENGGIDNDSIFRNNDYSKPGSYPVALSNGWSKWKTAQYSFSQTYRLSNDTNRTADIRNAGAIVHNFSYNRYARLYDDENKAITDSLGTQIFRNSVFWTNDISTHKSNFFVPLAFGVNYDIVKFSDSLNSQTFYLFSPEVKCGVRINDFRLDANALMILTDDTYKGDYQLNVSTSQYLGKAKSLSVFAEMKLLAKQPDYIFSHYLTETLAWDCNTEKTNTQSLTFGINWSDKWIVKADIINLSDYYFLDNSLNVNHGDTKLWQLHLLNDYSIGKWRFKGSWSLQKAGNEDVLHVPLLAVKQGFSYTFSLFKGKLDVHAGCDLNYFSKFYADVYSTQTGLYTYQTEDKIGNYLFADAYLNVNIDRFCMFIMVQHPYAGLINHNYFNSPLYPAEGFVFRYGFVWKLLD